MSNASTKHVQFFPWAHAPLGLKLQVRAARYDFDRDAAVHQDRHLVEADEPFEQLDLQLELDVPAELQTRLVPPGEQPALAVLFTFRADETRWRDGTTVPLGGQTSILHRLTLRREQLAGSVELSACLVRAEAAAQPVSGFAHRKWAVLADSRPWEIRIDRRRALGGVFLDVRYRSFKDDPVIPTADHHNLYRLELEGDAPTLWLNQDLAASVAVLDTRAQSGRQAALREVAFDLLAPSVWTQLFFHSARRVLDLGDEAKEWERAVVAQVCQLLHGRLPLEESLARLEGELAEPAVLLGRLDTVLQRRHELGRHLERLAENG